MRKILLLLAIIFLFPFASFTQTQTLVSGTLVDPNGIAYYPASVTACLSPATLNPTVGGRAVNPNPGANYCVGPTTTSVTGFFSLALWPNANISPAATTWIFSVAASGSGPPAGNGPLNFQSAGVTISGATQDVSTNINSAGTTQLKAGSGGISSVAATNSGLAGRQTIFPNAAPYNIKFDGGSCAGPGVAWTNTQSTIRCFSTVNTANGTASVTGNIATITFATSAGGAGSSLGMPFNPTAAGWQVGDGITITGYTGADTFYNGSFTISALTNNQSTTNSISFALTHANASSTTSGFIADTNVGPFTSAQTGMKGFGTNCNGGVLSCVASTNSMPIGTLTFVNSTTLTTTATATATVTAGQFWYFTDDRSKWCCGAGTVDNAIQTALGCVTVFSPAGVSPLPLGFGLTSSPYCGASAAAIGQIVQTDAGNYFLASGIGTSTFVIPPDEIPNIATKCVGAAPAPTVNGCLFSGIHGGANFTISGGGFGATGSHNAVLFSPSAQASFWHDISLVQLGSGDTGTTLIGFAIPFSNKNDAIYIDQFGKDACWMVGVNVILTNSFCGDVSGIPMTCAGNNTVCRTNNTYDGATSAGTIGRWVGRGSTGVQWYMDEDQDYGTTAAGGAHIYVDTGAVLHLNMWVNGTGATRGVQLSATGKAYIRNSAMQGSTNCIGTNAVTLTTGGYFNEGGNTCVAGTIESTLVPTCAMTTGGGTGPACALVAGSFNESGTVRMTPGTTPGTSGTTTLTFAGTFSGMGATTPSCTFSLANTGTGAWNAAAIAPQLNTRSTTAPVFAWNNTAALTAASTYDVDYVCVAR